MNWNKFDLNLLLVFDTVMEEKNLTRAGQRLGLTQPAVSHALTRLRHMLGDELFVRGPDGMVPTPRAERIAAPVREALQQMRITLEAEEFDASRAVRTFAIATNNYAARAVVPALVRRASRLAPSVVMEVRPIGIGSYILDQLDRGAVELGLAVLSDGGDRFKCTGLLDDEYAAMLPCNHPAAVDEVLSIEDFVGLPHVAITSSTDDTNFVDAALAERGLSRRVLAKVPLHSLSSVLMGAGALAVVPRRVATDMIAFRPLIVRPLPFPSPRVSLSMIWHRRVDHDPAHRWLRATVRASVTEA